MAVAVCRGGAGPGHEGIAGLTMDIELLADRPESIPTIARWYFHEWGHVDDSNGYEKTCTHIQGMLNRDHAPLHVLAVEDGRVLGVAQWKLREMDIYPDREHWVGGVYVSNESRGRGIASRLCVRAAQIAGSFGVDRLYLQTEKPDGGLYARLGWQPIEQVHYHGVDVLVMEKDLSR